MDEIRLRAERRTTAPIEKLCSDIPIVRDEEGRRGGFAEVPGRAVRGVELSAAGRGLSRRRLTDSADGFALVLAVARELRRPAVIRRIHIGVDR
ncbi:hypothetical protein ACFRCW_19130 [Streptomyces sp. NPDC056653]|uniref:hypothetical protein n=1 Tax=Streptomyces sp. NPDC056653 TaxID=3345894 RepID=UPI0036D0F7A0